MTRQHFAKYQRDELIFAEGSEGDEFFIVVTGRVGLSKRVDGRQELLHQIGPGELFGEIAVISSTPRSASAYALEPDTSVIAVDKARFLYLISQHPGFAVLVMETVSRWLRKKVNDPKITSSTTQLNDRMQRTPACTVVPLEDRVWQLRTKSRSCNSYLFRGRHKTILVDAGLSACFDALKGCA
jgi:CRP-like cAMP-binding protein